MKLNIFLLGAILGLVGTSIAQGQAQGQPATTPRANQPAVAPYSQNSKATYQLTQGGGFYEEWIEGRLSIGLTFSNYRLDDDQRIAKRGSAYIGYVNKLDEDRPNRVLPLVEYKICDYLSIGLSYIQIEASTLNYNNHLSDGSVAMEGPSLAVDLTYPLLGGKLRPHVGAGLAYLAGDFKEDTWWGLGYSSPGSWEYLGSPTKKRRGKYYRYIDVDDEIAPFFTLGLSYNPLDHLKLDASYRWLHVDPDCQFGYNYSGKKDKHQDGDFDLSGGFFLLSASYVF